MEDHDCLIIVFLKTQTQDPSGSCVIFINSH
nr:MAG TPA: hypothetical protein [Caudoviricetes sp.]